MKPVTGKLKSGATLLILWLGLFSCAKEKEVAPNQPVTPPVAEPPFDINQIKDTYRELAAYDLRFKWAPYNVHDPSIIKEGDAYYCYSTDVGYGTAVPAGIQIRKSPDLPE